jgi:ribonuclease D
VSAPIIAADSRALDMLCARVRSAHRVAIDTEFHAERSYAPRLMVVQLAFDDGAAIVDPLAVRDLAPLLEALATATVVGHALASDLKIFADRFGIVPPNVFDTQVAAAFLGYGMQISLADLVRALQHVRLAKSQTVSDWSARPFSERQL